MRTSLALIAAALSSLLFCAPAHAQRGRTFVASNGSDSNPCTFGSPCKTFQGAYNVTLAGGEVTAIDSAGFGPLLIEHAITITSPNGVEAGIAADAGGNAITITAGTSDAIVLRGLTLNGFGTAYNGIVVNSAGSLVVTRCVAQNFLYDGSHNYTGHGIIIQPTGNTLSFAITDTKILNNTGAAGIAFIPPSGSPTIAGIIDNTSITGNYVGLNVNASSASGGSTAITISNSAISNSGLVGVYAFQSSAAPPTLTFDNVTISDNADVGIMASPSVQVLLRRSVITRNGTGIQNSTSPNTVHSFGDNRINLNVSADVSGTALGSAGLQ
jgi:hypothetical protein